jgi:hypothetical protein
MFNNYLFVYHCDFLEAIGENPEVISSTKPHRRPACQFYMDETGRCSHEKNKLNFCRPKVVGNREIEPEKTEVPVEAVKKRKYTRKPKIEG